MPLVSQLIFLRKVLYFSQSLHPLCVLAFKVS